MRASLRLRLAVWYASLLAVIMAFSSLISYSFHSTAHYEDADRSLVTAAVHVVGEMKGRSLEDISRDPSTLVMDEPAAPDIYVRVYDSGGVPMAASPNSGRQPQADPRTVSSAGRSYDEGNPLSGIIRSVVSIGQPRLPDEGGFATIASPGGSGRSRLYAVPVRFEDGTWGYLEAGFSLDRLDQSLERLGLILTITATAGLVAAILGGWLIAGSALRPVSAMAQTARAIALSRGFSRRLPLIGRRDELGQLADTFNEMLASLDSAYRTQQRFVADASHELRTPLTTIQGNLELLERAKRASDSERSEIMTHLRQETARMGRLVADLLALAHADAGQGLKLVPVEMDRLLLDVFREARLMASGQKISVTDLDQLQVQGSPDRLKQLLLILVDNALKYTPADGEVRLKLRSEPGAAVVTVNDTGIGIDAEDLPHVFERFYRADKARAKEGGGSGLGLSIAQWIAERHGGRISVESTPGRGSTFIVRLPLLRAGANSKPVSRLL